MKEPINVNVVNIGGIIDFSCDIAPGLNLVVGKNGSGKTSLRNALAFLKKGAIARGSKRKGSVKYYINMNHNPVIVQGTDAIEYDVEWNGLSTVLDVLLFDSIPSGDDLYALLMGANRKEFSKMLKRGKLLKTMSPLDVMDSLKNSGYNAKDKKNKIKSKFKSLDDAKSNLLLKTRMLTLYYLNVALNNNSKAIKKIISPVDGVRKNESDAISDYNVAVEDLILTVKNPLSEEDKDVEDAAKTLSVFLEMKKYVDNNIDIGGFKVVSGKFVRSRDDLSLQYLSRGEKYALSVELKLYVAERYYDILKNVSKYVFALFDDFEVMHKEWGNSLAAKIKTLSEKIGMYSVVFMPKDKKDVKGDFNIISMGGNNGNG